MLVFKAPAPWSVKQLWSRQVRFNGGIGRLFGSEVLHEPGTRNESNAVLMDIGTGILVQPSWMPNSVLRSRRPRSSISWTSRR